MLSKWKRFNVVLMFDTTIGQEKLVLEITLEAKKRSNSIKPEAIDVSLFESVEVNARKCELCAGAFDTIRDPAAQTPHSRLPQLGLRCLIPSCLCTDG